MKKNLIAILALAFACHHANAQTEKGKQTLGLSASYNYNENSDVNFSQRSAQRTRYDGFSIGPTYGYFIANNWELAINPFYNSVKQSYSDNTQQNNYKQRAYGAAVSINRYFLYQNKFGFKTSGSVGYAHNTNNSHYLYFGNNFSDTNTTGSGNSYEANLLLSLVYFPMPKLGVTLSIAGIDYVHNKTTLSDGTVSKTDVVQTSFTDNNLGLSLFYVFGGK